MFIHMAYIQRVNTYGNLVQPTEGAQEGTCSEFSKEMRPVAFTCMTGGRMIWVEI